MDFQHLSVMFYFYGHRVAPYVFVLLTRLLGKALDPIGQIRLAEPDAALGQANDWNSLLTDKMVETASCQARQFRHFIDRQKPISSDTPINGCVRRRLVVWCGLGCFHLRTAFHLPLNGSTYFTFFPSSG
jgi:hypothetical protein